MTRSIAVPLGLLGLALAAADASAAPYWSSPGGACTADADDIQADQYDVNSASIQHTSTATAQMLFYCPISHNDGAANPDTLHLSFDSSVTTDANDYVTANFYRKTISSGTLTEIGEVGGSGWTSGFDNITASFVHTMDFVTYFYHFRVDIERGSTATTMTFRGVALES